MGLIPWLQKQLRGEGVTLWWDHGIKAGETYEKSIFNRIDTADLAILLVSDDFAASEYITEKELPRIRARHAAGTIGVIPLLVAPMSRLNRNRLEWITEHIQMLPSYQRGMSSALSDSLEWSELRARILDEIHHSVETLRSGTIPGPELPPDDSSPTIPRQATSAPSRAQVTLPAPEVFKVSETPSTPATPAGFPSSAHSMPPLAGSGERDRRPKNHRAAAYTIAGTMVLIGGGWLGVRWKDKPAYSESGAGSPGPAEVIENEERTPPGSAEKEPQDEAAMPSLSAGEFVMIPEGAFQMGDPTGKDADAPARSVRISAFSMAKFPVTSRLWNEVREWGEGHGYLDLDAGVGKGDAHPIVSVSWVSAVKWCNAASEKDGLEPVYESDGGTFRAGEDEDPVCHWDRNGYRLPTEAEWEKAARGKGGFGRFPWGDDVSHAEANFRSIQGIAYDRSAGAGHHPDFVEGEKPYTSPVNFFPPNEFGLHDMIGNSCEWCWDRYQSLYYKTAPENDPRGPTQGKSRVGRGGGWDGTADYCQAAKRGTTRPISSDLGLGLRLARSFAPPVASAGSSLKMTEVTIHEVVTMAQFAKAHGSTVEQINRLNGTNLKPTTVLASGSVLYVPGAPED